MNTQKINSLGQLCQFKKRTVVPPIYWRRDQSSLSCFSESNLQYVAYCYSNRLLILLYSKRKENWFYAQKLHVQMANYIDCHSPRLIPNLCKLSHPHHFSLPSTYKLRRASFLTTWLHTPPPPQLLSPGSQYLVIIYPSHREEKD